MDLDVVKFCFFFDLVSAQMTTIVCDESKLKVLLEEAKKCPKLKNIVKIGAAVTDEEKVVGDEMGVKIISFTDLEVSSNRIIMIVLLLCNSFT